jgi:hypothetical protein
MDAQPNAREDATPDARELERLLLLERDLDSPPGVRQPSVVLAFALVFALAYARIKPPELGGSYSPEEAFAVVDVGQSIYGDTNFKKKKEHQQNEFIVNDHASHADPGDSL